MSDLIRCEKICAVFYFLPSSSEKKHVKLYFSSEHFDSKPWILEYVVKKYVIKAEYSWQIVGSINKETLAALEKELCFWLLASNVLTI